MLDQMKQDVERARLERLNSAVAQDLPTATMDYAILEPGNHPAWYGALGRNGGTHDKPLLFGSREHPSFAWPHGKTIIRCW